MSSKYATCTTTLRRAKWTRAPPSPSWRRAPPRDLPPGASILFTTTIRRLNSIDFYRFHHQIKTRISPRSSLELSENVSCCVIRRAPPSSPFNGGGGASSDAPPPPPPPPPLPFLTTTPIGLSLLLACNSRHDTFCFPTVSACAGSTATTTFVVLLLSPTPT